VHLPDGGNEREAIFRMTKSWIEGADDGGFSLANLPYGVCRNEKTDEHRLCVAIGDYALDLAAYADKGHFQDLGIPSAVWRHNSLNALLAVDRPLRDGLRSRLQSHLSTSSPYRSDVEKCLLDRSSLRMSSPIAPGDFVDFFSSYHHAYRAMQIVRPDLGLHPNWLSLPVGYHSRTGTIMGPGEAIIRPHGQYLEGEEPIYAPTRALDFELEVGFVVGRASRNGTPVGVQNFSDYVFGLVLLNDWSARDFQRWEATPLGPLLSKSFATQVGAWVVPLEALANSGLVREQTPPPLDYLKCTQPLWFDVSLEVELTSATMREKGIPPLVICRSNLSDMHWNGAQQLAHVTSNGSIVRPGDLLGSGTVSGESIDGSGCLLELTSDGKNPIALPDGTERRYLLDGDQIRFAGTANGSSKISFGDLVGVVAPSRKPGQ